MRVAGDLRRNTMRAKLSTILACLAAGAILVGCSNTSTTSGRAKSTLHPKLGLSAIDTALPRTTWGPRRKEPAGERRRNALRKGGGVFKVGTPYRIAGRWYYPKENPRLDQRGIASWYGSQFHAKRTANGEIFDMYALTAAHRTMPLPSYAEVTNLANGRKIVVRVNDRGPFANGRIIDLSKRTAQLLDFARKGTTRVRVRYIGKAPISGDERVERAFLNRQSWYRPRSAALRP